MRENQLVSYANKFLQENYQMGMGIPLKINGRLKTVQGRFISRRGQKFTPLRIELSKDLVEKASQEAILDTLRHELIHYALYMKGLPYKDGQSCFENELRKHNTSSTRTTGATGKRYVISCSKCNRLNTFVRNTKRLRYYIKTIDFCTCSKCGTYTLQYEGYRELREGIIV